MSFRIGDDTNRRQVIINHINFTQIGGNIDRRQKMFETESISVRLNGDYNVLAVGYCLVQIYLMLIFKSSIFSPLCGLVLSSHNSSIVFVLSE